MSEDEMKDENDNSDVIIAQNDHLIPDLKIDQSINSSNENNGMIKEIHQVVFQSEVPKSPSTSDMPYAVNCPIDFPKDSCYNSSSNEISALQDGISMNESNSKSYVSFEENEDINTDISNGHQGEPGKYEFRLLSIHYVKGKGGRKTYKCDICGGMYKHAFSLKRHYLRTHINYDYLSEADISNCNISIQLSTSKKLNTLKSQILSKEEKEEKKSVVNDDINSHSMPGLYRCHVCYHLFNELQELKFHVANHPDQPNNKRFPCNQCDMTFSHRQNLVRHLSVHSGEKPYACRYCGKRFPTATNQKRHERIHEGVKPYECPHCSSLFTQSGDLKKHIRKQHLEFFHPCAFCLKYFRDEESLEEHVISHGESLESNYKLTNKKTPFTSVKSCNKTNALRPQAIKINATLKTSVEWRYNCNICWKRFNSYVNLCRHKRSVHTNKINQSKCSKATIKHPNSYSSKFNDDVLLKNPPSTEADFYADIAYNINDNLLNHLDGKIYEIQQSSPLVEKTNEIISADLQCSKTFLSDQLPLSFYNFPPDFHFDDENSMNGSDDDQLSNMGFNLTTKHRKSNSSESLESSSLSHSEMMHTLSLSPVNGDGSGDIFQCIDGVLDLSLSNKNRTVSKDSEKINTCEVSLPKLFLCYVCGENFSSFDDIENHKLNNHPNVLCNHLELEGVKDVPLDVFKINHSSIGLLKNCTVPPLTGISEKIICTKCQFAFDAVSDLHSHMLDCGGYVDNQNASKSAHSNSYRKKKSGKRGMKRKLEDTPQKKFIPITMIKKPKKESEKITYPEKNINSKVLSQDKDVFVCDGCERKFNYPSGLERHKKCCSQKVLTKKHERGKDIRQQHSCPNCSRSFTYLASLKKHISDCVSHSDKPSKKLKLNHLAYSNNNYDAHSESNSTKINSFDSSSADNSDSSSKDAESKYKENNNSPIASASKDEISITEIRVKYEAEEMTEDDFEKEIQKDTSCHIPECNSEERDDDLPPFDVKEEEKPEPNSHSCPNCQRTYTYLANFKKHVKDACPLRKEFLKSEENKVDYSDQSISQENVSPNSKMEDDEKEENDNLEFPEETENSVVESENDKSTTIKMDEINKSNSKDGDKGKARILPFNCPICHRIFLSYVKLLQHQLSHKLNSADKQEDEIASKSICQYCQTVFDTRKELNIHFGLCNKNNNNASKAQSKVSVKHKGGWPKGKSRKGYIPKHKRFDSQKKCNVDNNSNKIKDKKKPFKKGKCVTKNSKPNIVTAIKGNKKENGVSQKGAQMTEQGAEKESSKESSCSNKVPLDRGHNRFKNNVIHRDQLNEFRSGILRRMKRSVKRRPKKSLLSSKMIKTESLAVNS